MNIRDAALQLESAARAYGQRTPDGGWRVPVAAQRPVYLVGPPGVGKTAVVAQVAAKLGMGLAASTMTHHTRQTAIGLPVIAHRTLGGVERAVTEYTMSELVAEVWSKAEAGAARGILFLDEINCVSESLMPAMLQLLQYKTFGTHGLPPGWMIVCAGNPPRYNRYAHTFDPVVLDRLRVIDIEPDLDAWRAYAAERGVHPSVRAYLALRPEDFYATDGDGLVTARSWTDLSDMMLALEAAGEDCGEALFGQYLQVPGAAERFALFHLMHAGLRTKLEAALDGHPDDLRGDAGGSFDEALFAALMLSGRLCGMARETAAARTRAERLRNFAAGACREAGDVKDICAAHLSRQEAALDARRAAGALDPDAEAREAAVLSDLRRLAAEAASPEALRSAADAWAAPADGAEAALAGALERGFDFAERAIGDPNARLVFLNDLRQCEAAREAVRRHCQPRFDALWASCDPDSRARRER